MYFITHQIKQETIFPKRAQTLPILSSLRPSLFWITSFIGADVLVESDLVPHDCVSVVDIDIGVQVSHQCRYSTFSLTNSLSPLRALLVMSMLFVCQWWFLVVLLPVSSPCFFGLSKKIRVKKKKIRKGVQSAPRSVLQGVLAISLTWGCLVHSPYSLRFIFEFYFLLLR